MKELLNRRVPAILWVILILIGIPLTIYNLKNQTASSSQASESESPQDVKVTNISNNSFTVTYRTQTPSIGSVNYGPDKQLGTSVLENIDEGNAALSPRTIHSISLKELTPSTKYYLEIVSGDNTFLNNGTPYEITTGPEISSPFAQENIIKGKIILPNGDAPSEAIILVSAQNSQILSGIVNNNGEFSFSLKDLRTDDLTSYFNITNSTVFNILATDGFSKSSISASLGQTGFVPTITLSNDYDFTQEVPPAASKSAQSSGFLLISHTGKKLKPKILNPKSK
jgi:hypothetical protein